MPRPQEVSDAEAVTKLLEVVEKLEAELYEAERMRMAAERTSEELRTAKGILDGRLKAMEDKVGDST